MFDVGKRLAVKSAADDGRAGNLVFAIPHGVGEADALAHFNIHGIARLFRQAIQHGKLLRLDAIHAAKIGAEDWAFEAQLDAEALNMGLATSATAMIWREKKKQEEQSGN